MTEKNTSCFEFIKYCNNNLLNTNEYGIAKVIIDHIENIKDFSLEDIAEEANISIASVSRFIKKTGFSSFQDFKYELEAFNRDVKMRRIISHTQRFMRTTVKNMSDSLYDDAINNLMQTKLNLDIDKLKSIVKLLKGSKSVTFVGDDHELNNFYTLQLDLLVNGVPSYLVRYNDIDKMNFHLLNENDTIVYIDLYNGWFNNLKSNILKKAKSKKIKIIIFCQEDFKEIEADIIYKYGIENSINNGYYSIQYLNSLLCEMIYYNF